VVAADRLLYGLLVESEFRPGFPASESTGGIRFLSFRLLSQDMGKKKRRMKEKEG